MKKGEWLNYASMGFAMFGGLAFFTFIGYYLDAKQDTVGWTIGGVLLGICYCGYIIWKIIKLTDKST